MLWAPVGSTAEPTTLDKVTDDLVTATARDLSQSGIGFAAIDTCAGYILEVNVANPGGLGTLSEVYGRPFEPALMQAITARFNADRHPEHS